MFSRGCWPKEVDPVNRSSVERFRRRIENREEFQRAVERVEPLVMDTLRRNTIANLFTDDFQQILEEETVEAPNLEKLTEFS